MPVHFVDAFTSKSDVDLLKTRAGLGDALLQYKARVENHFSAKGYRIKDIRLDKGWRKTSVASLYRSADKKALVSLRRRRTLRKAME